MALTVPEDRKMAHLMKAAIGRLRADADLTNRIGGADRIYPAKRAKRRDDPVAITVEAVNSSSTWNGFGDRTFHVLQAKLVLTRPELEGRDPLYPQVVTGQINDVLGTSLAASIYYRGRDDAGGMDVPGDDPTARIQWPQRFRYLVYI